MRQVVQLNAKYKNLNPGEFAGFEEIEARHILSTQTLADVNGKTTRGPIGSAATLCRVVKPFSADEAQDVLKGKPAHLKAQHEIGDHLPLLDAHAEKLQKAALVEPLVPIQFRRDVKIDGATVEKGVEKNVTPAEAATLEKSGDAKRLKKRDD